jgi:nuclear pore complex protein Nup155
MLTRLSLPGAVELPLHCAQVEDAESHGRNWWLDGCPAADPRAQAWELRRRCYDLVLDSLSAFDAPASQPGASADAQATRSFAYELALSADDEVFHSTLYDWLLERGLADELLEVAAVRSLTT